MTVRDQVRSLIKEMDAQREDLRRFTKLSEGAARDLFHIEVVNPLQSLLARAHNMEAAQKMGVRGLE